MKIRNFFWSMVVISVLIACCSKSALAEVAYSSFGPGNDYQGFSYYGIGRSSTSSPNIHVACQFTSIETGILESIDVAIQRASFIGVDNMQFNLWTDEENQPGSLLWTGTVEPNAAGIWTLAAVQPILPTAPLLVEGETYWLSARAESGNSQYGWNLNSQQIYAMIVYDSAGGTNWQVSSHRTQPAFRVNVTRATIVAPESFTVTRGEYISGGLPELTESDNMDLSIRRLVTDLHSRTEFGVKSTSPTAFPTTFGFSLEGAVIASSNVVQTIELFDYDAAAWELVNTMDAVRTPGSDSVVTATPTGDLSRFVEAGTMCIEARIHFQSDSPRQRFASNTDQAVWTIGQ